MVSIFSSATQPEKQNKLFPLNSHCQTSTTDLEVTVHSHKNKKPENSLEIIDKPSKENLINRLHAMSEGTRKALRQKKWYIYKRKSAR